MLPTIPENGCRVLGGPIKVMEGLGNGGTLRSCGGDEVKHSPSDIETDTDGFARVPNLKGGSWLSSPLDENETVLVVKPFVRARDGLLKDDFLRL